MLILFAFLRPFRWPVAGQWLASRASVVVLLAILRLNRSSKAKSGHPTSSKWAHRLPREQIQSNPIASSPIQSNSVQLFLLLLFSLSLFASCTAPQLVTSATRWPHCCPTLSRPLNLINLAPSSWSFLKIAKLVPFFSLSLFCSLLLLAFARH